MFNCQSIESHNLKEAKSSLLARLPFKTPPLVLVIGDLGLDEYFMGEINRISPEAPVPIVEVKKKECRIGLAGYVAQNIISLGGRALLFSVIGEDDSAKILKQELNRAQISTDFLIEDKQRITTRKTRVMCKDHHVVRLDHEKKQYLSEFLEKKLLENFKSQISQAQCVILEDYGKGILSERLCQDIIQVCKKNKKLILVDPHPTTNRSFYKGADLLTPNQIEALRFSKKDDYDDSQSEETLNEVASELMNYWACKNLVITQGKKGMTLYKQEKQRAIHIPTYARNIFDVTGAGDAVIAAMSLGLGSGMSLEESCVFANFAGGVAVGKIGCLPIGLEELKDYIHSTSL